MESLDKSKALDRLQRAHDDLKSCRFRITLSEGDLPEYISQLWELSDAWSNLCYFVGRPAQEQRLVKSFCSWIHDYNSLLLRIRRNNTLVKTWLPYFEAMLNVTHTYLDTGNMDVFYNPFIHSESGRNSLTSLGERWCLVTQEMCGIDSPELPRYFPVTLPLCTDSEKMKKYFLEKRWYGFKNVSVEQRLQDFMEWELTVKPVLIWVNQNLVSKSARESGDTSLLFRADSSK